MRLCLGASLLVSPFPMDGHTTLAQAVAPEEAGTILHAFDARAGASSDRVTIALADVAQADATIRRLDGSRRAPSVLHRAPTGRPFATIAAFDRGMAAAADAPASPAMLA